MWKIKKEQGISVYRTIVELVLSYIQSGQLLPGERLPSERKLAELMSVNRSTVVHALEELEDLGWLIRRRGSGSYVTEGKWGISSTARTDWKRYLEQNAFNKVEPYVEQLKQLRSSGQQSILDVYTGELPLELIPSFEIPSLTWKQFLVEEQQDEFGYLPLRQSICRMIEKEYQFTLSEDSLLITSGAQQALFLILQVLLSSGDSIAVEDPSFLYALPIFQAAGIRLYGIPMDSEGIQLEALEQEIRKHKIKMVMVNPSFQNPTGNVMGVQRRKQLVALCQKYQLPIVEDDVFGQLTELPDNEIPPLKKLDPDNVLYIGSLSKLLGSTTKIGWLSAPASVNKQIAEARKVMDFSLSIFPQLMGNIALNDLNFSDKLFQLKQEVMRRGQAVYQVFVEIDGWQVKQPRGGFYLWATFQGKKLKKSDWQTFLEEGLLIAPSYLFSEREDSIRINFSRVSAEQLPVLKEKLKRVTARLLEKQKIS